MIFRLGRCSNMPDMIYKENDNLDFEEINRYRSMTQEERDKFIKEEERKIKEEIENSKR